MPANPKYLSSTWSRVGKVSAAILGGYMVTIGVHMAIGVLLQDKTPLVMTTVWSSWILWVALMIIAFSARKAWKVWLTYIGVTVLTALIIYLRS